MKGDGETHPLLSPDDEFADFETVDKGNLMGLEPKTPEMLPNEYARAALKRGLAYEREARRQPVQVRHDRQHRRTHVAADDAGGELVRQGALPGAERDRVEHALIKAPDPELSLMAYDLGAAGLAAVWARENTRESHLGRHGPQGGLRHERDAPARARLRRAGISRRTRSSGPTSPAQGYARGVPMGGDLRNAPQGKAPSFMIRALRDPDGANLDRIQIVKGWVDAKGETHEKVYDVAWSDDRQPGRDGKLPPVGNTVDVEDATYTNSIGDALLMGYWKDPDFDPEAAGVLLRARAGDPDAALDGLRREVLQRRRCPREPGCSTRSGPTRARSGTRRNS